MQSPPAPLPERRRRGLTEADRAAWADYARHVAPLPGHALPDVPAQSLAPEPGPEPARSLPATVAARPVPARAAPYLAIGMQPPGLDNSTWTRFRTGRLAVARTLDLHGRTAQRAFHALDAFLQRAHADRLRCVEVITGRGSGESGGVIRRELPLWLNLPQIRPMVLAAAHPHAANVGSVRLLLRRPK